MPAVAPLIFLLVEEVAVENAVLVAVPAVAQFVEEFAAGAAVKLGLAAEAVETGPHLFQVYLPFVLLLRIEEGPCCVALHQGLLQKGP